MPLSHKRVKRRSYFVYVKRVCTAAYEIEIISNVSNIGLKWFWCKEFQSQPLNGRDKKVNTSSRVLNSKFLFQNRTCKYRRTKLCKTKHSGYCKQRIRTERKNWRWNIIFFGKSISFTQLQRIRMTFNMKRPANFASIRPDVHLCGIFIF